MEQQLALYRNRSEAPTSVMLAMILHQPDLGPLLLEKLSMSLSWTMWRRADGETAQEKLSIPKIPKIKLEASSLVFPFRDASLLPQSQSVPPWRGEIDVVAIILSHAVIGIELKVLSTTAGLASQMDDQVAGLTLLADRYQCPFLAQIALAPTFPSNLNNRVNKLSFNQLSAALKELGASNAPQRDVLAIGAQQLDRVLELIEPQSDANWSYVTLEELRKMKTSPGNPLWVGVIEGIEKLNFTSRPRWKIACQRLSNNWYPLPDVLLRVEALMTAQKG